MSFIEIVDQVVALLKQRERVSYRVLKHEFALNDEAIEALKDELISAQRMAVDEDGKVLVWVGETGEREAKSVERGKAERQEPSVAPRSTLHAQRSDAERRQLTVMFCDLVGSTALSAQLDPEELREVVRAYQEICTTVIRQYDGHVAQHLGDGLLVYFGYPVAHEDDAQRAARAGLEVVGAIREQVTENGGQVKWGPLQVRIGIHTGLVVIGEIGSSEKREMLALGETPNIAARIQGQANPDEVMISAATYRLVEGLFACEDRGQPELKGVTTPLTLYRIVKESDAHSRFEVVVRKGLTPLVGRENEFGLLQERWQRVKDGAGQVVLLSGEPGIGKSRLVEALKETVEQEGARCRELRCSPYAQNSVLYPIIDHLQRVLQFHPDDTPNDKLQKLKRGLDDRGEVTSPLLFLRYGALLRSWTLVGQGQKAEEILQNRQNFWPWVGQTWGPYFLSLLAEMYEHVGEIEEGLTVLSEALGAVEKSGMRWWEAELYRLYGELSLRLGEQESERTGEKLFIASSPYPLVAPTSPEACFLKAIEISRHQQAKSLELRAVMSLVRLRQHQAQDHAARSTQHDPQTTHHASRARLDEARTMLAEIFGWFTEGFDTKDLQDAKTLLDELA
jgi:class 3 adenylate cyclase